jgi:TolB-like protein
MAVMPFKAVDSNAAGPAEVLPEDLGSALVKAGFQVASRTNAERLSSSSDRRGAALELGVDSVLDGTVRSQGTSVRLYMELVNARTGFQLWSGTFTVDPVALVAGDSATTRDIVAQIRTVAGGRQ